MYLSLSLSIYIYIYIHPDPPQGLLRVRGAADVLIANANTNNYYNNIRYNNISIYYYITVQLLYYYITVHY